MLQMWWQSFLQLFNFCSSSNYVKLLYSFSFLHRWLVTRPVCLQALWLLWLQRGPDCSALRNGVCLKRDIWHDHWPPGRQNRTQKSGHPFLHPLHYLLPDQTQSKLLDAHVWSGIGRYQHVHAFFYVRILVRVRTCGALRLSQRVDRCHLLYNHFLERHASNNSGCKLCQELLQTWTECSTLANFYKVLHFENYCFEFFPKRYLGNLQYINNSSIGVWQLHFTFPSRR